MRKIRKLFRRPLKYNVGLLRYKVRKRWLRRKSRYLAVTIKNNGFSHAEFLHRLGVAEGAGINELITSIYKSNKFVYTEESLSIEERSARFPGDISLIIRGADKICEGIYDLLGSGPCHLGVPPDWHVDFKSGHKFDRKKQYTDITPASYPGGYDIKVPWELSRLQFLVWLGQAYFFTRDEKYSRTFVTLIEDWLEKNPFNYGVNWACAMDVAIRAANIIAALTLFKECPLIQEHQFQLKVAKALLLHGIHIEMNLEGFAGGTNCNHYISNLAGLFFLGVFFRQYSAGQVWLRRAHSALEREVRMTTFSDGGNYEGSSSYHRLVLEIFLTVRITGQKNGVEFSKTYDLQIERMLDYLGAIMRPNGTTPFIGDHDNGRFLRLAIRRDPLCEWNDFRYLLALGGIFFRCQRWNNLAGDQGNEEVYWLCGADSEIRHETCSANMPHVHFMKDSGVYVFADRDCWLLAQTGGKHVNRPTGHLHNDLLSFELYAAERLWIVDPGSYTYTQDYKQRNEFRCTVGHNTLQINQDEQFRFSPEEPFAMDYHDIVEVEQAKSTASSDRLTVQLIHKMKEGQAKTRRSFCHDQSSCAWTISDEVSCPVACTITWMFHLDHGLEARLEGHDVFVSELGGNKRLLLEVKTGHTPIELSIVDTILSRGYGYLLSGKSIRCCARNLEQDVVVFRMVVTCEH